MKYDGHGDPNGLILGDDYVCYRNNVHYAAAIRYRNDGHRARYNMFIGPEWQIAAERDRCIVILPEEDEMAEQ